MTLESKSYDVLTAASIFVRIIVSKPLRLQRYKDFLTYANYFAFLSPFLYYTPLISLPFVSLSFPCHFPTKLYSSFKAHINLIQDSYELNDKILNVRKLETTLISQPLSWRDLTHDG